MVERLLTLDEVARWLRVPKASLYRQRYEGALPGSLGFRAGRHVRFRESDLSSWIEEQVRPAGGGR